MTFVCPHCHEAGIQFGNRACPNCGFSLGVPHLFKYYACRAGHWLRTRLQEATAVQCLQCHTPNPINAKKCRACGTPITVGAVTDASLRPVQEGMDRLAKVGPSRSARRVAQIVYLALSIWLLTRSISMVHSEFSFDFVFDSIVVSVVVGAVAVLLFAWLMPSAILVAFHRRATWMTKLAVLCNGLTACMWLLQQRSDWWHAGVILAAVIGVLFLAARVLTTFVWPAVSQVGQVFRDIQGSSFNPSRPQGRRARRD